MNNTIEAIQKDINNDFALADLLYELIKANVQRVAEEVVADYSLDHRHIDSAKVGSYEVWIQRLCGMLRDADRDYLLQLLQQHVDKPCSRS